jgi:hypothetical protein
MQAEDHQSKSCPGLDPVAFRERGYTVVGGLFAADEVERLRSLVVETVAEMEQQGRVAADPGEEGTVRGCESDLLSIPSLRGVLLDPRLLRVIGELLGGEPVYFGDSSVRIGGNGIRGWHRDNTNRTWRRGSDWHGTYPLLRCGLYLQDHSLHSGGLAMRPKSHKTKRLLPALPELVKSKAGELVAWNMRTVHAGEAVRMRGMPGFPLNPRMQSRLPARMRVPEDRERVVLFMAFGLPSSHLDNYVGYLRNRDYMQRSWSRSRFGPEVWEEAERAGLHMRRPIPAYGTPEDRARSRSPRHPRAGSVTPAGGESFTPMHERAGREERVADVLAAVREHPAVAEIAHTGHSLIDFGEPRLELEIARLLRGWTLARGAGSSEEVLDPGAPSALLMGARAGLGLDPAAVAYTPAISGSRLRRAFARQLMRGIARFSKPERVRVAAVTTGALARALAAMPAADLHEARVGVLPLPGLDDGSGALFAIRHRLPLLTAYGFRRLGPGVAVALPERLGLSPNPELDRALSLLVERVLAGAAHEQDRDVRALAGLHRTHALRVVLLGSVASGAARLLVDYARERGLRVGVLQHGACELHELDRAGGVTATRYPGPESEADAEFAPETFNAARFADALRALAA